MKKKNKPCSPNNVAPWKTKKQQARDVRAQQTRQLDNNAIEAACKAFPYFRY